MGLGLRATCAAQGARARVRVSVRATVRARVRARVRGYLRGGARRGEARRAELAYALDAHGRAAWLRRPVAVGRDGLAS